MTKKKSAHIQHVRCCCRILGKNKFGKDGHYQVILKRIELPVVPRDECQQTLRKTNLGRHFILDPSFMCAGGESGKDTCQGTYVFRSIIVPACQ